MSLRGEMITKKRIRIAETADIMQMSLAFRLPETKIKLAIFGPVPPVDSITLYGSASAVLSALKKSKGFTRKKLIIQKGMDLCESTDDLYKFESRLDALLGPESLNRHNLLGEFESRVHVSILRAIRQATSLREAHAIWVRHADTQYEPLAHKKMLELITGADLLLAIGLSYADNGADAFSENSWHLDFLMCASQKADATQAKKALISMAKSEWVGEEDSPIIPILVAKAAELYRKK
jgi:hypothetical protein